MNNNQTLQVAEIRYYLKQYVKAINKGDEFNASVALSRLNNQVIDLKAGEIFIAVN